MEPTSPLANAGKHVIVFASVVLMGWLTTYTTIILKQPFAPAEFGSGVGALIGISYTGYGVAAFGRRAFSTLAGSNSAITPPPGG